MNHISLFFSAFVAATLFPFYSEVALLALLYRGESPAVLWLIATAGNCLGAVVNWLMGRYLLHFQSRRWFPFKANKLQRAERWFQRYGKWSLLFSWLPLVGDGLTFIAGMMRTNFFLFVLLTALGKGARYAAVIASYRYYVS